MSVVSWREKNVAYEAELYRWNEWFAWKLHRRDTYPTKMGSINFIMFGTIIPNEIAAIILYKYCGWDTNYVYWEKSGFGPGAKGKPPYGPTPPTSEDESDEDNDQRMIQI